MIVMPAMFLKGLHFGYKNYWLPFMGLQTQQQMAVQEETGKLTPIAKGMVQGGCPYHAVLRFFGFPVKSDKAQLTVTEAQKKQADELQKAIDESGEEYTVRVE